MRTALILLTTLCLSAQEPEQAVFRSDVSLVHLLVTVKDSAGATIGDLNRQDFTILEERKPIEVAVFERRTSRALSVALLLDTSLSTAIELSYERQSAGRFLANLLGELSQPQDNAAVFMFSDAITQLSSFTRNQATLENALNKLRPQTGTSVYDAILLVSEELTKREGRRVIIIITDGGDTTSRIQFADALRAAHSAEAVIYPLIVVPIRADAGRNRAGEHALITLANNSGGEAFIQYGQENMELSFREILKNLRTQYLLGFYPRQSEPGDKETFRKVVVEVAREDARVLSRSGYFAAPPPILKKFFNDRKAVVRVTPLPVRNAPESDEQTVKDEEQQPEKPSRRTPEGKPRPPIIRPGK